MENISNAETISAKDFYRTLDTVENYTELNLTAGYYPSVDELKAYNVKSSIVKYLPIIAYFANNPLKDSKMNEDNREEYKNTVKYCNDLLTSLELE